MIPDNRPGFYYVSMVRGKKYALLLGPYPSHQQALDNVEQARTKAEKIDPWTHFDGFGTMRSEIDRGPGRLNTT